MEWCERHLLARIHRYTLQRLRREIEPVAPRDFMRFLFDWQHLSQETQVSGPEALAPCLRNWKASKRRPRHGKRSCCPLASPTTRCPWLDDLCTAGRTVWTRLRPPTAEGGEPGNRRQRVAAGDAAAVVAAQEPRAMGLPGPGDVTPKPPSVHADNGWWNSSRAHGASFFDEMADGTRLLRTELEDALSELVMQGRIHCDSFAGVRSLLVPASKRSLPAARRRRGASLSGIQDAGRWALVRRARDPAGASARAAAVEHAARTLLRRYGVICWRLLEREAAWLPPWRELVRIYQRLEARGEIRGGRFIAGLSGEQFALPEAIAMLRQVRRRVGEPQWVCVSAADPANLLGGVLPGARVPRVTGSRVLYRDGVPVGTLIGGRVEWLHSLEPAEEAWGRNLLIRGPGYFPLESLAAASRHG